MARGFFGPLVCGAVLQALRGGATLEEAARRGGIAPQTLKKWLTRGRKESGTDYAAFARDVDDARSEASAAVMDEVEFHGHLAAAVRAGSVQAMKLWWEIHGTPPVEEKADEPPPASIIDELAARRASGG